MQLIVLTIKLGNGFTESFAGELLSRRSTFCDKTMLVLHLANLGHRPTKEKTNSDPGWYDILLYQANIELFFLTT
uniref:AlNc14C261G9817 protein n=1 Tax=Albugo laibachii Nc14 TaxID=890382 RepID=F0WCP1_9STRA|nr:AlNc14C60G4423 [Albugo laibachii Nc14]CCA24838.1 AlNc14C261G9817 [Albugo laibachii Nc14]|eukprot:CCA24838.1 AlNc14C261G9817 [Albugo laibachii Nc14]